VEVKETISAVQVLFNNEQIFFCYLLELPWKNNLPKVSCIPHGRYILKKRKAFEDGSRFDYPHLEVLNVPGRDKIKWHIGNYVHEIEGCGVPGKMLRDLNNDGLTDMVSSRLALNQLMACLEDETELNIIWE